VCEKGVADSNAGDGNILTSVEVRMCKPLFHRTFYVLKFVGRQNGVPMVLSWQKDFIFDGRENIIGWYFVDGAVG
jgi:hypothetical protein